MGRRIITKDDITKAAQVQPDDYKSKIIKYIPAEIVTAYVTLEGIIKSSTQATVEIYWIIFLILLALTPLYIWRVTNDPKKSPAWDQIIIAFFSFAFWVFALGGPFGSLAWYRPLYGALILPIYTLVVPLFKK